ncbi:MAG: histidine phosphatase family protein [Patescibacteria group bacterium]
MKHIYLVRHGESEGNVGLYRQGPQSPLTEKGREQARVIAERFRHVPLDGFVSSTMTRAHETAEIISAVIGKPFDRSELFIERLRPSAQYGMPKKSPESAAIDKILLENYADPDFRFADEENFKDLDERAQKSLDFFLEHPGEHILVITHGLFMRVLVGKVIFGDQLTGKLCDGLFRAMKTHNTGLSIFVHDQEKGGWVVRSWNDHSHLE